LLANPPLDRIVNGTASVSTLVREAAAGGVNLEPARDSRPFFFQFETGVPQVLVPVAYGALGVTLLAVLLLVLRGSRAGAWRAGPVLFAALGAGFMALELGVIQRTQLFLGHPTLALTLVLGTILLGSGFGSLLGGRVFAGRPRPAILWSCALVVVFAAAWLLAWPLLSAALQGAPLIQRELVTVLSLLPMSLALGVPLPSGLRTLRGTPGRVAAAWAINGVFSVVGSVATVVLALLWGYEAAFLLGIGCYLLALAAAAASRYSAVPV